MNSQPCQPTTPLPHTALVAEGGGQRGIFTAGILDAWLRADFNPFELLIGTSAGAQNLSSYMTGQLGFGRRAITRLSSHPQFFKVHRTLLGRHALDLDWYFDQVKTPEQGLNMDCGFRRLANRQLMFSATRVEDRRAHFFEPQSDNWIELLKASSALPILYKNGVRIGDQYYVDGGLSAPLPVEEAYQRGAGKIVVLRTVAEDANVESPWAHKIKSWLCQGGRCPQIIDLITHHEERYARSLDFIHSPPADAEIIQIFPPSALRSNLVASSRQALQRDYEMGVDTGKTYLEQLGGVVAQAS
ncbi:patatin family protein [Aestuariirhabdus sp. Z084]|uniref:patatin-like phospholipase family protein n=1 Tax=Aestuariirhabdus haliotis TaxID=2918751 RepID=UPI00201B3F56|nr:patatin family protein [Aestuariirhabdus haliotis]MCL6416647.1 patatin family protein [Aestuariirhabdus haliotis]MCL6420682.1 patatin family protein [Aestuariirhabdus haliotis]